jgi:DNA-binding IclR family transcriptional regulator
VLREVKKKGYAISTGKDVPGVRSAAVPVFDVQGSCIAALSIVTPVERFTGEKYIKPLQRAAAKLTSLIAGRLLSDR